MSVLSCRMLNVMIVLVAFISSSNLAAHGQPGEPLRDMVEVCMTIKCSTSTAPETIKKGCGADVNTARNSALADAANELGCDMANLQVVHETQDCAGDGYPDFLSCSPEVTYCKASLWRVKATAYLCDGRAFSVNGEGATYCEAYCKARLNACQLAARRYCARIRCMTFCVLCQPVLCCGQ